MLQATVQRAAVWSIETGNEQSRGPQGQCLDRCFDAEDLPPSVRKSARGTRTRDHL